MQQMSRMEAESQGWPILEPIEVEGMPRPVAINKDVCVVGTRAEVNLKLSSPLVSRTHAMFVADRDSIYLRDLASRNHTYLNEKPIREAVLRNGDMIALGPLSFRCRSGFDRPYDPADIRAPAAELVSAKDGNRIPFTTRTTLIGSRSDCDIVLAGKDIDPSHAILFEREGRRYIRDLRTVDGTWVNDQAVGQLELNDGDQIRIGQTQFAYQHTDEQPPQAEAAELPLAAKAAVERSEMVDGEPDDEHVDLELADDTAAMAPDSVGLSDWEATNLANEPPLAMATEATEATVPSPDPDDSLAGGAILPTDAAPVAASASEAERDVIPIRLDDLSDAPAAPPAADEASAEPHWSPVPPDETPVAPAIPESGETESGIGEPIAQSPGQHDRLPPEEKLTELLGELAQNIAEVQSAWQEVRTKHAEEPLQGRPGTMAERVSRHSGESSDNPDLQRRAVDHASPASPGRAETHGDL